MQFFKGVCNTVIKLLNCILPDKWQIPKLAKTGMLQYPIVEHVNCRCVITPYLPDEVGGVIE